MEARPRVVVSACLLGAPVRFDGGHRRHAFVTSLGVHVDFVPVCPEVEAGLGAPRPSLRLVSPTGAESPGRRLRVISSRGRDATDNIDAASARLLAQAGEVDGVVLKKGSPPCGPVRVKVYGTNGMPLRPGRGVFAGAVVDATPWLPVEDEGRLEDARLRDSFLARVFTHARLRRLLAGRWSMADLVSFHAEHKLLLLAHHQSGCRQLGQLVARGASLEREELATRYRDMLMAVLSTPVPRGPHVNVLQHMAGHFTHRLDPASRAELQAVIGDYASGAQPLAAPRTLLRHHIRHHGVSYPARQAYLSSRIRLPS
jgi:uncharacterized protein YbgA (DUF1722 family)/uncharacterized protein YbbK (DUF523 family)